jgi:hypothetical protein
MSVNDEHSERRADSYWPISVNEEKTNQFGDSAKLRRLRHEQDRRADTLQELAQTVVRKSQRERVYFFFQMSKSFLGLGSRDHLDFQMPI